MLGIQKLNRLVIAIVGIPKPTPQMHSTLKLNLNGKTNGDKQIALTIEQ